MNPVLLAIDIQEDFFCIFKLLKPREQFERSVRELTAKLRERRVPIIHILTRHREDRSTWTLHMKRDNFRICMEGTDGARELEAVGTEPGESVMYKTRWSAFYRTELDHALRAGGYDTLIMAGFMTHACIRVTAIDAYQRDYDVVIARDCIDTYDPVHERITLDYLSRYAARIMTNAELFAFLEGARSPRLPA